MQTQINAPSVVDGWIFLVGDMVTAACNLGYLPRKYYRLLNKKASPIKIDTDITKPICVCGKNVVCEEIKTPVERRAVKRNNSKKRFLPKHNRETIRGAMTVIV